MNRDIGMFSVVFDRILPKGLGGVCLGRDKCDILESQILFSCTLFNVALKIIELYNNLAILTEEIYVLFSITDITLYGVKCAMCL